MDINAITDILNSSFAVGIIAILIFAAFKFIPKIYTDTREDRQREHEEIVQVIKNNTDALTTLKSSVNEVSSKIDNLSVRVEALEDKKGE